MSNESAVEASEAVVGAEEDAELIEENDGDEGKEEEVAEDATADASPATNVLRHPAGRPWGVDGLAGDNRLVYDELLKRNFTQHAATRAACSFRKYAAWCKSRGLDTATAPSDALTRFARDTWRPQGQNNSAGALMQALDAARTAGLAVSPQNYTPTSRKSRMQMQTNGNANAAWILGAEYEFPHEPPPPPAGMAWASLAGSKKVRLVQQRNDDAAAQLLSFAVAPEQVASPTQAPVQPVPATQYAPAPAQQPPPRPVPSALRQPANQTFPVGGRVRIHKLATGYEPGIPPGQRIGVGEYMANDVSTEGSIRDFIQKFIVPNYGPKPGAPDTIYVVERLDDRKNVTATYDFPFAAQMGGAPGVSGMPIGGFPGGYGPPPQVSPPQWGGSPQQASAPSSAQDKFLDYLMDKEKEQQRQFEEMRKQFSEQKGMDPTTLMLLTERVRPPAVNWAEVAAEFRHEGGGLGGLPAGASADLATSAAPVADPQRPLVDALTGMANRVMDMAEREPAAAPAAATPVAAPGFMEFMNTPFGLKLSERFLGDGGGSKIVEMLMGEVRELKARLDRPAEKTKGVAELLGDLKAVNDLYQDIHGKDDRPGGLVEVASMLLENADKVADLVNSIMSGLGNAPVLPKKEQKALTSGTKAAEEATPQQPTKLPEEAMKAIADMASAPAGEDGEQMIANALFSMLVALRNSPEPFPRLGQAIVSGFLSAESKPELRALVTSVLIRCGARALITEAVIEKIATVLHKHYALIYSSLSNGQVKVLRDAEENHAGATATPALPMQTQPTVAEPPAIPPAIVIVSTEAKAS